MDCYIQNLSLNIKEVNFIEQIPNKIASCGYSVNIS